jgi:hypothetical protein
MNILRVKWMFVRVYLTVREYGSEEVFEVFRAI